MNSALPHLVFHGAIVLLFGLLLGAPHARAIKRNALPHIVNSWRVAHLRLPIGATLMFAVALLLPSLNAADQLAWGMTVAFIVSAYGFCVSTPLAALPFLQRRRLGQADLHRKPGWCHGLDRWCRDPVSASLPRALGNPDPGFNPCLFA